MSTKNYNNFNESPKNEMDKKQMAQKTALYKTGKIRDKKGGGQGVAAIGGLLQNMCEMIERKRAFLLL